MECNGTEITIWKMPEWNEMEDNLPYQFHTRFCALYLQKNTYRCRVVINYIVTEVFNFNIYGKCLSTNHGTLVFYIAETVYVLHHCKYIAICSIDVTICQVLNFVFSLQTSRKLVYATSFPFQLNFIYIFSFSAYNNSFWCQSLVFLL